MFTTSQLIGFDKPLQSTNESEVLAHALAVHDAYEQLASLSDVQLLNRAKEIVLEKFHGKPVSNIQATADNVSRNLLVGPQCSHTSRVEMYLVEAMYWRINYLTTN